MTNFPHRVKSPTCNFLPIRRIFPLPSQQRKPLVWSAGLSADNSLLPSSWGTTRVPACHSTGRTAAGSDCRSSWKRSGCSQGRCCGLQLQPVNKLKVKKRYEWDNRQFTLIRQVNNHMVILKITMNIGYEMMMISMVPVVIWLW